MCLLKFNWLNKNTAQHQLINNGAFLFGRIILKNIHKNRFQNLQQLFVWQKNDKIGPTRGCEWHEKTEFVLLHTFS